MKTCMWLQGFNRQEKNETRLTNATCRRRANHVCVTHDTCSGYTLTVIRFRGGEAPNPPPHPSSPLRLWPCHMQRFKTKTY